VYIAIKLHERRHAMSILPKVDPEFKSLIPPLTMEERSQLEQNILSSRKCYDPIILWDGFIIDGHNRFEICFRHGIEFQVKEMTLPSREAAMVWILENQLSRRNLTEVARIEIVLLKEELLREKARRNQSLAGGDKTRAGALLPKVSKPENERINVQNSQVTEAGVGKGTFIRYTQIKKHGSPELLASVQSGELKIGTAHRILEINKKLRIANKMYKHTANVIPSKTSKAINQQIHDKLTGLSALLKELIAKLEEGAPDDPVNNQSNI